jgi:hypothetical protein
MNLEELIELLDGEAEIVSENGDFCFDHTIFLNGDCIECGINLNPNHTQR